MENEYEERRYLLFINTFVAKQIVFWLRNKYGLKNKKIKGAWDKIVLKKHFDLVKQSIYYQEYETQTDQQEKGLRLLFSIQDVSKKITPEITKLAQTFNINEGLFRVFVLYNNVPKKIYGRSIIFQGSPYEPITEFGYYIKINKSTSQTQILEAFKDLKLKQLALDVIQKGNIKTTNNICLKERKRRDMPEDDNIKIPVFLKIEKKIPEILKYKVYINDFIDYDKEVDLKEYKKASIGPAIENVVDKELKSGDTEEAKKLKNRYYGYYYDVTDRYKLPTIRDLSSIHDLIFLKA